MKDWHFLPEDVSPEGDEDLKEFPDGENANKSQSDPT